MPSMINTSNNLITSVNGQTGDIILEAKDVKALPESTKIPTNTSDLNNDSNYVSDTDYVHTDNNYTTEEKESVGTIKDKVDKVVGKGLSTNDLTDGLKVKYDEAVSKSHTHQNSDVLDNTTASFTIEEKNKLKDISDNAQVNVQTDWNETDNTKDSFLKNKPYIPSKTSDLTNDTNLVEDPDYVHTDNNYTDADKISVSLVKDKVDKIDGKGLSANDFTDELKRNYDTAYSQSHVHDNKEILDATSASYSVSEQEKLGSIENGAQKNTITGVKGSAETTYRTGNVNITKANIGLGYAENTADKDKPVSTAQQKAIDEAYANSNKYTDQKIADLIDGAPETLDTLKEISDAISASKSVEEALNKAIGTKADQTELDAHTGNDTIHITSTERTNWNDANSKKHTHSNKSVLDGISASNITNWNKVSDKIDKTGDLSDATVTFTTATDRANLTTGEKISTAFGKIAKWFGSLKSIAFSGSYKDLSDTPILGTAAAKDVATSGNASTTQVVMGNDTRLTDARKASDVSAWAKQASKPSYTASEVGAAAANHTHSNYMLSTHEVVSLSEPTNQLVGDYWIKRIN